MGNICSVALTGWLLVPAAQRLYGRWISGRSVRIHEVAHRTLIELPDTQKGQEPGGGDVLDFRAL